MGDTIDLPNIFWIWTPMEKRQVHLSVQPIDKENLEPVPGNIIDDITKGYGFFPCDSR